jgi:hypothetical protein
VRFQRQHEEHSYIAFEQLRRPWLQRCRQELPKQGEFMTRILLQGLDPETVDFSNPALPPGMTVVRPSATEASPPQRFLIITDLNNPSESCYGRPVHGP